MMDNQEAFNKAYIGIVKQGRPSIDTKGECMYRGPGGCKCAVGHLIPDDKYDPKMEGLGMWAPTMRKLFPTEDGGFLIELQGVHDNNAHYVLNSPGEDFLDYFKRGMEKFAEEYDLTVPEVV